MNYRRNLNKRLSEIAAGACLAPTDCLNKEFVFGQSMYRVLTYCADKGTFICAITNHFGQTTELDEIFVRRHCTPVTPIERPKPVPMARYSLYPDLKISSEVHEVSVDVKPSQPERESVQRAVEQTRVLSFADGASYHLYASAEIAITNNCVRWQLVIGVNGFFWADDTRLAGRGAWQDHRRIATVEDALRYGLMLAQIYIESMRQKYEAEYPEGAEQRLHSICYRLKRQPLRQFVHAVYPSAWQPYVKIVVVPEHLQLIRSEVAAVMRGYDDVRIEYEVFP